MTDLPFAPGVEYVVTRPFQAGRLCFRVGSTALEVVEVVERMFADLPDPVEESAGDTVWFTITAAGDTDRDAWGLAGPVVREFVDAPLATVLAMLITSVNLGSLAAEPERLHLHAACVARGGRAVVISAARDTGKTTTVARLVRRGWSYLSDEAVAFTDDDLTLHGWPKPLSVKPGGRVRLPEFTRCFLPAERTETDIVHVPLGAFGASIVHRAAPSLIVVLRRDADDTETPDVDDLHPADTVVRLMAETMDAARFGPAAVVALARLAASCRCVEVRAGSPDATAEVIERLSDEAVDPLLTETLRAAGSVAPSVVTVVIGERAVLHDTSSGRILALDEMATAVWWRLGGWPRRPGDDLDIDLEGPMIGPFVDQLAALGLVHPSPDDGNER